MFQKWLDSITKCALFEDIPTEQLLGVLQCMNLKVNEYRKDDYLTLAGDTFTEIGIILQGTVALTKETASGGRVIIGLLGPGEMFGEMAAYSGQKFWPLTVIAKTNCTVMFFSQDKIVGCCDKVCSSHKKLIMNMLKVLAKRALMLNRKVEYLSIKSLRGKICSYLLEEYNKNGRTTFQLDLNRNELADFINVSRPSLSRELGKMRDEGLIDFHSTAIKIKDFAALQEQCE
ncbi:MAG TPA: Crp/Fnr family transcriptional regulator [Peptococcaceae bacterium]|nr:Crp/Fnr family transcriptional regulator [Peptococcaceae bacterium]